MINLPQSTFLCFPPPFYLKILYLYYKGAAGILLMGFLCMGNSAEADLEEEDEDESEDSDDSSD